MHLISLAYRIFFVICTRFENVAFFLNIFNKGEMLEWLKRHAWKACIRQKRIGGSNPPYSAGKPLQKTCNGFFADGTEVYYGGVK